MPLLSPSRPHEIEEQRPRQDEPHHAAQDVAAPQVAPGPVEELVRPPLRGAEIYQDRHEDVGEDVEGEAAVGLEAERAGADAGEGGGQGADVGDCLVQDSRLACLSFVERVWSGAGWMEDDKICRWRRATDSGVVYYAVGDYGVYCELVGFVGHAGPARLGRDSGLRINWGFWDRVIV